MRVLDEQAVHDMAVGATVLGTGGGGDPYVGKLMALSAMEHYGAIKLLDPEEVPDDALVVPAAMMGAPTVLVEKVPNGEEALQAFESLQNYLGKTVFGVTPIEAGGVNSMIPLALAARLGIPVIDADGMGRAFPELQMVTFHLNGVSATPMVLNDEKGNSLLLETVNNVWTERIARTACVEMGGSVMLAIYPMAGKQFKESAIKNTMTLAEKIGRVIRTNKGNGSKGTLEKILEITKGYELFRGKVVDVNRRTVGGFARGTAELEGMDTDKGKTLKLDFQNENLIAVENDRVLATVPDLICVLDVETAQPITTEGLKYGYRVVVIAIPCADKWRTKEGIENVGPRYFGYDVDYIPVEQRVGKGGDAS